MVLCVKVRHGCEASPSPCPWRRFDTCAGRFVVPEYAGEINFALRGVNLAGAKFKYAYRRAEAAHTRAERAVQTAGTAKRLPNGLRRGLMFNTFHDILPASCTEIALEQQSDEVRGLCHEVLTRESDALVAMAGETQTHRAGRARAGSTAGGALRGVESVGPAVVGLGRDEAGLDHRPLFGVSDPELRVLGLDGRPQGLQPVPFGHNNEPDSHALNTVRHAWKVAGVEVVESGPLRSKLAVKLRAEGGASEAEFTVLLEAGRRAMVVEARVFWHEVNARLKRVFPNAAKRIEVEVPGAEPGASVVRGEVGEGPGMGWVRAESGAKAFALGTDALSDFDLHRGTVQATVVRSSHYTQSEPITALPPVRGPVIDRGDYRFRFVITDSPEMIPALAEELVYPPAVQMTWAR